MVVHSLMLSIQLLRCRPRLRAPATVPCMMVLERLSCRVVWPNHASLRLLTVVSSRSCGPTRSSTLFNTNSLVLCSLQDIPNILLMLLVSNDPIFFSVSARRVQDLHPYKRIETTSDLKSLYLVGKEMLLFQIMLSLDIAAVAWAIRMLTSTVHDPSLESVAPRY